MRLVAHLHLGELGFPQAELHVLVDRVIVDEREMLEDDAYLIASELDAVGCGLDLYGRTVEKIFAAPPENSCRRRCPRKKDFGAICLEVSKFLTFKKCDDVNLEGDSA